MPSKIAPRQHKSAKGRSRSLGSALRTFAHSVTHSPPNLAGLRGGSVGLKVALFTEVMKFYCQTGTNALFIQLPATDPDSVRLQPIKILILDDGRVQLTGNGLVRLLSKEAFAKSWVEWEVESGN